MRYIDTLSSDQLRDKKIFLRVDLNVPVENNTVSDAFRIRAILPTLQFLLNAGARVVLVSHISAIDSFASLFSEIKNVLNIECEFVSSFEDAHDRLTHVQCVLVENIRSWIGEEENTLEFAEKIASGFDIYVNDAFSVSHRTHASIATLPRILPAYAGLLMQQEITHLTRALNTPKEGKVVVLGGAKIATKLPMIHNFLDKAEAILIGGALANDFLKARDLPVGTSLVDENIQIIQDILGDIRIHIPTDVRIGNEPYTSAEICDAGDDIGEQKILDIGPRTADMYNEIIAKSTMVIWNGPMGLSEYEPFAEGTKEIAKAIANTKESLIGGGDTIAVVTKLGLLDRYGYVCGAGGAMLEFLGGAQLPGLKALGFYEI